MITPTKIETLTIGSPAFADKDFIPSKYTCEGENINPAISIGNLPDGTRSIALIMDDPDAPSGTFYHWIVWNIRPVEMIQENSLPGVHGKNSYGKEKYNGPCPPSGTHRYFFKVYALDKLLEIPKGADRKVLETAMEDHILAGGELVGLYQKTN